MSVLILENAALNAVSLCLNIQFQFRSESTWRESCWIHSLNVRLAEQISLSAHFQIVNSFSVCMYCHYKIFSFFRLLTVLQCYASMHAALCMLCYAVLCTPSTPSRSVSTECSPEFRDHSVFHWMHSVFIWDTFWMHFLQMQLMLLCLSANNWT